MGKIAVYTRVSSARQAADDAYSLDVQKERCIFLLKSKGYNDADIDFYCDAGISGTTILERDQLKELLDKLEKGQYDGICCYDLSRISRSISHTLQIFKLLKENNLRLYTCDGAFNGDINGQNAKIMVSIYSMLNELFIDQLRERVIDGMSKSVEAGNYFGGPPPYGYKYEYYSVKQENNFQENQNSKTKKRDIKKRLIVNEEEKPIVELIFTLFVREKYSIKNVAQHLNLHGYKTRAGKQFATATVQKILENPVYCSRLFWAKRRQKKKTEEGVRVWEKKTIFDVNFYDLPLGNHQAIIPEDVFLEALERLRSRRKVRVNENTADAMRGITKQQFDDANKKMFINILRCPGCGGRMTSSLQPAPKLANGKRGKAKVYYKCNSFNAGRNYCDGYYSVQEERAFNLIKEDFFKRLKEAFMLVKEYQQYIYEKYGTDEQMLFDKEIAKIKDEIKILEKNKTRLVSKLDTLIERQLLEDSGTFKYERLQKMINDTEIDIAKVQQLITEQQNNIKQAERRKEALLKESREQEQFDNIEDYFSSLPLLQKRQLLEKVYSRIVINTISNARYGPKKLEIKEIEYNQYSSTVGLCKILGVQDFKEFNNYLKTKGKELNILEQHYGDVEEYLKDIESSHVSSRFRNYIKELDATRDKSNDEFIEELIDECLEETEQVSENITLDEIIKNFDKTYEEFKFKYFLKKVLQNEKVLT
ncbi:MAG TPA: recombinase family protein [Acetivibrio sp.]|jgi:site-specific DNA recombinase|uniref:recombinase family protein n=2 Tax=Acetivibrio TaxID=35829 RepID=UPI002C5FAF60|nr:recombinase family protein [Acetivibrio sp.]HOM03344.1 recombinase family protein [Acetivibrio sp.]